MTPAASRGGDGCASAVAIHGRRGDARKTYRAPCYTNGVRALVAVVCLAGCASAPRVRLPGEPSTTSSSLDFVAGLPTIPVVVGGRTIDVLLDSGGFDTLSLSPELMAALGEPTGRSRTFTNARGERLQSREYLLREVRIGALVLRDVRAFEHRFASGFAPPVKTGYLGLGILRNLRVLLDYRARRVLFASRGAPLTPYETSTWRAAEIVADAHGATVESLLDGRPHRLILDTGATASLLRGPSGRLAVTEAKLGATPLGPMTFAQVPLDGLPVDGLLGADFFAAHPVLIDFPAHRIAIAP
jgi:Aspartyl protease